MIKATHYVIDLETLGTRETAVIASIGAIRIRDLQIDGEAYYRVDMAASVAGGRTLDVPTLLWWLGQAEAARAELLDDDRHPLQIVLQRLADFMRYSASTGPDADAWVWGNGPAFDCAILRSAYRQQGIPEPWPYYRDRDLRTLLDLYPEAIGLTGPFVGTRHHALHDARHEARQLIAALQLHTERQGSTAI